MRLAVRTLRFRKGGFIATFVAVVFGTAIVMACGGLMETGIRSNVSPERLAAAPIVVTGKQSHLRPGAEDATALPERVGVPTDLVAKIRSVEGVSDAIGDLTFPAAVLGSSGLTAAEGHNWSSAALAPYKLTSGRAPTAGQVVSTAAGTKVGDRVTYVIDGSPQTFAVSGIAHGPAGHAFFSDHQARQLAGHPARFADVGVLLAPGTDVGTVQDRIKAIDGGITVSTGIDRGLAEHPGTETQRVALISIAGSFGGIAAMTMMFVVASTLALSAQHREREFALLRGIGTTPG